MRKEVEKKTVIKSIKMSPEQEKIALENAKAKGMSFSSYAVDRITHSENSITPETLSIIQEIINCAERTVKSSGNMREIQNMKREEKLLWESLK